MKNTKIKYQLILLCCFAIVVSCSPRSFKSKKHQHTNFLGEKKKKETYQSFNSFDNFKIKINEFELDNIQASNRNGQKKLSISN